jgi:hypothetical protein
MIDNNQQKSTKMTNDYPKTLKEILTEAMQLRSFNIEKLSALTNISERHLIALYNGDFKKLPAAPYTRGYLTKIAEVLNLDAELLWQVYKNEYPIKTSGLYDKLPSNRFALRPFNKKFVIIAVILILGIIYLIWQAKDFFGTPTLEISSPIVDNFIVSTPSIKLTGKINPQDKLMVNNEEVVVLEKDGWFEKDFSLAPGLNTVEFKIKRFLGKEVKVIRQIIYQP